MTEKGAVGGLRAQLALEAEQASLVEEAQDDAETEPHEHLSRPPVPIRWWPGLSS